MRKPADWKRTSDPYALWLKELAEAELKGIHERIEKAPPIGLLPDGTSVRIMHSKQVPATPRRQPPAVRCYMRSTCALRPSRCDTGNETVLSLSYKLATQAVPARPRRLAAAGRVLLLYGHQHTEPPRSQARPRKLLVAAPHVSHLLGRGLGVCVLAPVRPERVCQLQYPGVGTVRPWLKCARSTEHEPTPRQVNDLAENAHALVDAVEFDHDARAPRGRWLHGRVKGVRLYPRA